jgi:serine protease AprX
VTIRSRSIVAITAVAVAALGLSANANAKVAPSRARVPDAAASHRTLADLDGDHLADSLGRRLAHSPASARSDVVVTFTDRGSMGSARRSVGLGHVSTTFHLIDGFAARLSAGQIRGLSHVPGVLRIEPNFAVHALDDAANDDFGVTGARSSFGVSGAGTQICIPDSGVDLGHEQLDSKAPIGWHDYINGKANPYDDLGHGTHVASIALGDGVGSTNAAGMQGVAPDATLSATKVIDDTGFGEDSVAVQGIQWCAARGGVDVISLSLGSELPSDGLDAISQAVDAAAGLGKIVVAAAGNSGDAPGTITAPGSSLTAITVGAAAEWSAPASKSYASNGPYLAPFSSRGPTIDDRIKPDIVAPGVTIGAAKAGTVSTYAVKSGTSMATPYVAGVAALLRELQPTWAQADVRAAIEGTAFDAGPTGKDPDWGAGLIDAKGAVAEASGTTASTPFPAFQHFTGTVSDHGVWSKTFTLTNAQLDAPIAATITLDGEAKCILDLGPLGCLEYGWVPDLEADLVDPSSFAVQSSTCALGDPCAIGRQETLQFRPAEAGTYTIEVYPAADGDGTGGTFSVDLFTGPLSGSPPPPSTMHVGDLDPSSAWVATTRWRARATVEVHDASHGLVAGATVTGIWTGGTTGSCVTSANGRCSLTKRYAKKKASVSFGVTSLQLTGVSYAPADNHDPDADSTGTSVTISRPV